MTNSNNSDLQIQTSDILLNKYLKVVTESNLGLELNKNIHFYTLRTKLRLSNQSGGLKMDSQNLKVPTTVLLELQFASVEPSWMHIIELACTQA